MQELIAKSWIAHHETEPDEASVRAAFLPPNRYRISRRHYPLGTRFGGTMIPGVCVVLRGQSRFFFGELSVLLQAGHFAELPGGPYELVVEGDSDLEMMLAWELPRSDRPSSETETRAVADEIPAATEVRSDTGILRAEAR
jgi:hypothetical protein